jgi:phosphate transport system protein
MEIYLDSELKSLKNSLLEMFQLVNSQMEKSKEALINFDKDLAREVRVNEKRVNSLELNIDRDVENFFALYNPLASDLRFIIAALKINSNLERIGDIADGIAHFVININNKPDDELLKATQLLEMFDTAISILGDVTTAFDEEDSKLARSVFKRDEFLDEINLKANEAVAEFIRVHPDKVNQSLYTLSTIRKLERVGDQSKNIAEEIIFSIEAKVLKHKRRKIKKNPEE